MSGVKFVGCGAEYQGYANETDKPIIGANFAKVLEKIDGKASPVTAGAGEGAGTPERKEPTAPGAPKAPTKPASPDK